MKAEPKDANGILLKMFENLPDKERVLISKINDVATVISKEFTDELFKILADILNFQYYEKD